MEAGTQADPGLIAHIRNDGPTAIHGPRVTGCTPGRPFLFLVPATGTGPLEYAAENLPQGLEIDESTGIISGSVENEGARVTILQVRGVEGAVRRGLQILAGTHQLARTPPMGWNSWNVWGPQVDHVKVREAADAMVSNGLAAHGYQFINIDDTWEGTRCPNGASAGTIRSNERFPDMSALADHVHAMGLKLGIYSSPGPKTCAGFEGSMDHEAQDARRFADWGIDYLKYDWCSFTNKAIKRYWLRYWPHFFNQGHVFIHFQMPVAEMKMPFVKMREALDAVDRDIVYSIVPMTLNRRWNPAAWGLETGANAWRTTGDIVDKWHSVEHIGFPHTFLGKNVSPGRWNDPDMLVVGVVGGAWNHNQAPTRLTPAEQITHITLWSMIAAPLLIGCDLTKLDSFTLDLLSNDDVIAVDQDPLGKAGRMVLKHGPVEIWTKPLWDCTTAVALFNRGESSRDVSGSWQELAIDVGAPVRDLWRQADLGPDDERYSFTIESHGAILLKAGIPSTNEPFE